MVKNLKTQFTLLIVGIFLIPSLAGLGIGIYSWWNSGEIDSSFSILMHIGQEVAKADDLESWELKGRKLDALTERNGHLVVTSMDGDVLVFQGERFDSYEDLLAEEQIEDSEIFRIQINYNDEPLTLLLLLDPPAPSTMTRGGMFFPGVVLFPILLTFLFVLFFSLNIVRSINGKIKRLEKSMRVISGGNLDHEIPIVGSDQFASLAESLNNMRKKLKEDQESQVRFLMSVSHDLKTPLSTIDGYLDALMDGFAEDDQAREKFYTTMKDKADILSERIAGLIAFAKMSTGEWTEKLVLVNANDFFVDFIKSYEVEAELRGFNLTIQSLPDLDFDISMDEHLAYRALENLVQNAMKYSDERKSVTIGIERDDSEMKFSVGNMGRGIKSENHDAVFSAFFRESTGRNETGSGLGLSTVKHIVDSHGWSITLSSEQGDYTEFTIHIPI